MNYPIIIRDLHLQAYQITWDAMRQFVDTRTTETPDEIWLVEHPPIYTLGQNGKTEHLLNPQDIPVLQVDRGGQVTYHGPGQLILYPLLDLKRLKKNVRELVNSLERSVINFLAKRQIKGHTKNNAPGVYVDDKKICSLGLRIRRGFSYHGLSLNVDMNLEPFTRINPCGYQQLVMTQLSDFPMVIDMSDIKQALVAELLQVLDSPALPKQAGEIT